MKHKTQNLIVGAGISGIVLARLLAEAGETCVLIDQRPHVGGNCYDYQDPCGIRVHQYGPHIFRTNDSEVWAFLSRFTSWHPYIHHVKGYIEGKEVPLPFNLHSLALLFPAEKAARLQSKLIEAFGLESQVSIWALCNSADTEIAFLGKYIYEHVFLHYTEKQWGRSVGELASSVLERLPVSVSYRDQYFREKYQAVPAGGYTALFENMLAHPNITVHLNVAFSTIRKEYGYRRLFYSGPIDEYFGYAFGALPYRSLRFDLRHMDMAQYQSVAVINYPNEYDYTRVTEYKHFLPSKSSKTVVAFEYPSEFKLGENERYYPIPAEQNIALYQKYLQAAEKEPNVFFFGRLGGYKYCDMQTAVKDALALARNILSAS